MKALILTGQPKRGIALKDSFSLSGFDVQVEDSALYAMTLLERNRPDVIVSTASLSDLSGAEFFEMVRSDPQLSLVPFVLLDDSALSPKSDLDLVLPLDTPVAEVVRSAYKLILELTRKTYIFEPANPIAQHGIQGQLGDMSLFELAQWLAKSTKTGRLRVEIEGDSASLLFNNGQLIHAKYAGKSGEDAVLHLLLQAENKKKGHFHFEPLSEADFFLEPVTIRKNTDQLLLSLAIEMDHLQQGIN
jgi:CheY-like chemotaxis protein